MARCKTISSSLPIDDYNEWEKLCLKLMKSKFQLLREVVQYAIEHEQEITRYVNGGN